MRAAIKSQVLKKLAAEHPDWCFTCGKYWLDPRGIDTCFESPIFKMLKEVITELDIKNAKLTKPCKCSMRIKSVGDGCDVCNPSLAIHYLEERIEEANARIADLESELTEMKSQ